MVELLDVPGDLFYLGKRTNISELMAPANTAKAYAAPHCSLVPVVQIAIPCPSSDLFSGAIMQMDSA